MSRIIGLVSPLQNRAVLVEQIARIQYSLPNWHTSILGSPSASFAFSGWSAQPRIYQDETLLIALDGHIYAPSHDDSCRLIAELYRKDGFKGMLAQLNGDFAIALFDGATQTLWLGRDRFGVKPLYYAHGDWGFAFASQPSSLLRMPFVPRGVNQRYVAIYAASHYRYFDNHMDESPFAGVSQLPPAHFLQVQGGKPNTSQPYWELTDLPDWTDSPQTLAEQYRDLLQQAVSIRFRALQRPAFTLSGGMDSSSVLAMAVRDTAEKQHAFSTVYTDKTYDESEDIQSMLAQTVSEWHAIHVDAPDVFSVVQRMVRVHDEPVATATWLSHFILSEEVARQGFGALFGGLGGDELNAGEYEYFIPFFADLQQGGQAERLDREIGYWSQYHSHPLYPKNKEVVRQSFDHMVDFAHPGHLRPDPRRMRRYEAVLNPDYFHLEDFNPILEHPFGSYLKNRTYQDLTRETIPCCLRAEDRQTTPFGIDHALPFLDHSLVEFMYRVPSVDKYQDGVTKHLLRQAMQGILPEETRTRIKKTGWNAPGHLWFSGAGKDTVLDMIGSQRFRERGIYDAAEAERLLLEHDQIIQNQELRENHMMFLWQLVNLNLWLDYVEDIQPIG
jgi:asparagine synthase (glutamine-hydrolysing)